MRSLLIFGIATAISLACGPVHAGVIGKGASEAAEFVLKKFGKETTQEGVEALTKKVATAAARHGDDAISAIRKVGPKALNLADEAGENAPRVMRLLSAHGDVAASVLSSPRGMSIFARYGDEAAAAMIKHRGIAEPLIESLGEPAIKALNTIGPRSARRVAMLTKELPEGQAPELLAVIARYGDPAMEFIWKNKGVLAGGAVLTGFIANPGPYLAGTNQLAGTVTEGIVKPTVQAAGGVAQEAAGFLRWALTILLVAAAVGIGVSVKCGLFERPWVQALGKQAAARLFK